MSFKIVFIKYKKPILIICGLLMIPILALIFKYLYSFGIEIGENLRILYENALI